MSIKQMWRLLGEAHPELNIGFTSLREYIRLHLRPIVPDTTVPLEIAPGQQAQVDFGYAGRLLDPRSGRARKAWCFVMTLAYSRLRFVRYVFDQTAETWFVELGCQENLVPILQHLWVVGRPKMQKTERLPILVKYQLVLANYGKPGFTNEPHFEAVDLLIQVRNTLMHYKLESVTTISEIASVPVTV